MKRLYINPTETAADDLPIDEQQHKEAVHTPDKTDYLQRIAALRPVDQAFMDGFLFAKVTEAAQRGA